MTKTAAESALVSSSRRAAKVTGTGSGFPARILTNAELTRELAAKGIDTTDEWIVERTGIRERRIADPNNPAETNSGLAYQAATRAMEMAGVRAEDLDAIFYATCSTETLIPSTACWLQDKLKAKNAFVYDINAACSGFVYALATATQFIENGSLKRALVVGAEVMSPLVNWSDRGSCILFGDGAGAVVVEAVPAESRSRIYSQHMSSDGSLWELLHIPAGGTRCPANADRVAAHLTTMQMKGKEIFRVATRTLADFAVQALEKNGVNIHETDWLIPHQANLRIIEAVANRIDFPMEKVIVNVDRYGNTSAATVPTALDEAVRSGKIKPGQSVVLDVFGAGLTYGSIFMRW